MTASATRNVEPIPGYLLRERLGSGGYGEVWKADAPGGIGKAIKFIYGFHDGERAMCELKALNRIKGLRHPFLMSLERIEVVDGQLLVVTELADGSLKDRFDKCCSEGMIGIPREEMLIYMRDAADALDYMNTQHSLQHLDVKPENLLLVGEHVKVADFGLVKSMQDDANSLLTGMTPLYASPELFNGTPSRRSDQYSLAILFQQMLSGVVPFPGRSTAQLAAQHLSAAPILYSLSPGDQKVIAKALAKDPQQRFASCREMVDFLSHDVLQSSLPSPESWFAHLNKPRAVEACEVGSTQMLGEGNSAGVAPAPRNNSPPAAREVDDLYGEKTSSPVRNTDSMLDDMETAASLADHIEAAATTVTVHKAAPPTIRDVAYDPPAAELSLGPTIVLGVGRLGGAILQKLKQRLEDRFPGGEFAGVMPLLIDVDVNDLMRAGRGDDGAGLDASETLAVPLRRPQDYRRESTALLRWLSRRWLYNIPRSQKTEGMRPLGRLALVDHAGAIRERLTQKLRQVNSAEMREAASQATGLPFDAPPRIVVVGAISGGTGGGMMLDLCHLSRQLMERLGLDGRNVSTVMLHHASRGENAELSIVNTYAALMELAHYSRGDRAFPGDPACGLEPRPRDASPVSEAYLLDLGRQVQQRTFTKYADRTAEFLYLKCCTRAASYLSRNGSPANVAANSPLPLKTFGLAKANPAAGEFMPWASLNVCADMIDRWLGHEQPDRAAEEAQLDQAIDDTARKQGVDFAILQESMMEEIARRLPAKPDDFFTACRPAAAVDYVQSLPALAEKFGICCEEAGPGDPILPEILRKTLEAAEPAVQRRAEELRGWVLSLAERPGMRICLAERAVKGLLAKIVKLTQQAHDERKRMREEAAAYESFLGFHLSPADPNYKTKLQQLKRNAPEYKTKFLEYGRLRMRYAAVQLVERAVSRLRGPLTQSSEQLMELRRDMRGLADQLRKEKSPAADDDGFSGPLQQAVRQTFTDYRGPVSIALEHWAQGQLFREEGGFLTVASRGGEHRGRFLSELFRAGRRLLLSSLGKFDVLSFMLHAKPSAEAQRSPLASCLEAARPKAMGSGSRRVLAVTTRNSPADRSVDVLRDAVQGLAAAEPAAIDDGDGGMVFVSELIDLQPADVAVRLIDARAEFVEYAKRVHSRSDITFESLV